MCWASSLADRGLRKWRLGVLAPFMGLAAPAPQVPARVVMGLTAPLRLPIGLTKPLRRPTGLMLRVERGLTAPWRAGKLMTPLRLPSGLTERRGCFCGDLPRERRRESREDRPVSGSEWLAKAGRSEVEVGLDGPLSFIPV